MEINRINLNKRTAKTLTIVVAAMYLAGCSALTQKKEEPQSFKPTAQQVIDAKVDAAMLRVADLPMWSSSADAKASFASLSTDALSVDYQGDASHLLRSISAARSLGYDTTGPTPHQPLFVFVKTHEQPYIEFLKDLDRQLGQRADVVLTDERIELRYR